MNESNLEYIQNQIIDLVKTIQTGTPDNWRINVQDVLGVYRDSSAFASFPVVMVLWGDETLNSIDSARNIWNGKVRLMLLVYTKREDMEAITHDLKRLLAANSKININTPTARWIMLTEDGKTQGVRVLRNYLEEVDLCVVTLDVVLDMKGQKVTF